MRKLNKKEYAEVFEKLKKMYRNYSMYDTYTIWMQINQNPRNKIRKKYRNKKI